jgi:nitrite reductase/ring-hydroxylating ferredoxin subunit
MSEHIKVAQIDQLAPGKGLMVKVKGREVALFNIEGSFYAISNSCSHSGGPLAEGRLYGKIVTCPWHGAQFDATTGQCCSAPATKPVATFPVRIEGNSILIEIT